MTLAPAIESRIVRYADLVPCRDAFIDTRSPGSDQKENFTIIGPGVAENPNQHVHISEPHGFNIGGARQPPRCLNSQHSHETVEVFYVHSGQWRFMSGEHGTDGEVFMGPGDLISLPTRMFRGFENVGEDEGFLWAVLGGDDAGHVLWAPYVFAMARDYGLVLLEDGTLIDTAKGEAVPAGAKIMPETTAQQVEALTRADSQALAACVVPAGMARPPAGATAPLGVTERLLIGAPPIDWPHGFTLSEATLAPGAALPPHRLRVPDVWFVQEGAVAVAIGEETALCGPGDTITVPVGTVRALSNPGATPAKVVQVRGGDGLTIVEAV
ncbi:cupin domain-containing protein [Erythrobacter sp. WG]|uniref:cupin domain-containing protein n=1 Tax=Erythrobacter sp. WG TaxID=2985510 RepID=UPI00226E1101|nr:cupin domain-containing protein [Erythrobacter sp. WG]MCX9147814.1 cupin domain-containing protein [Erythrobacter sp. WG]